MILDEGTCTYRDTSVAPGYVPFLTFRGRLSIFVEILIFCEILWNLVRSCYFSLRLWFCKCLQLSCFHFSQEWLRVCEVLRQKCWLSVIITTFHNKNVFFVKSCEILRFFVRDWLTVYTKPNEHQTKHTTQQTTRYFPTTSAISLLSTLISSRTNTQLHSLSPTEPPNHINIRSCIA